MIFVAQTRGDKILVSADDREEVDEIFGATTSSL